MRCRRPNVFFHRRHFFCDFVLSVAETQPQDSEILACASELGSCIEQLQTPALRGLPQTMSFRKRNVGLSGPSSRTPPASNAAPSSSKSPTTLPPGVRPSPLDGRPTTSTGTQTLDNLLAGHAGLALGNTLLVEESGTTDFAGTLLRYYAAEGIVQGHKVHVVGVGEQWGRELPGLVGAAGSEGEGKNNSGGNRERMKIAWRYERLGEFGTGALGSRGGILLFSTFVPYVYSSIHLLRPIRLPCVHIQEANSHSSTNAGQEP